MLWLCLCRRINKVIQTFYFLLQYFLQFESAALFIWNGIKIVLISGEDVKKQQSVGKSYELYTFERIQINLNYLRQVNAHKYRWKEAN